MKKESWQDSEKTYEILVDDMSPLARTDLRKSGLTLSDEDNVSQVSDGDAASGTLGITGGKRVLIAAAVLCAAGVLGVAFGMGIGKVIKPKRPQKTVVSDSSLISSQAFTQDKEDKVLHQETLKEARFDIDKTAAVKNIRFTVLDGMCDEDMLFLTVEIGCPASLIGKSSGKVPDPYVNVRILPDETKLELDSLQTLARDGSRFTVRAGFRLPQALKKEQEVYIDFYGVSVSREKINPKTGFADVICNVRQHQPETVSFAYDGQKGDFARRFYTKSKITLNNVEQDMDVAYVSPWFCQFSLYASTTADHARELPAVKVYMKDGTEITAAHPASVTVAAGSYWEKDGSPMAKTTYLATFEESIDSVNVAYIEINGVKAERTDLALSAKLPSLNAYGYDETFGK